MYPTKERRNKALISKRKQDPVKWSFRKLAAYYKLDVATVYNIYKRDQHKYS